MDIAQCGIGYTCRKGLKPESPNQDLFLYHNWGSLTRDIGRHIEFREISNAFG